MSKYNKDTAIILATLRDKRKLRDIFSGSNLDEIQDISEKFNNVIAEILVEYEVKTKQIIETEKLIRQIRESGAETSISLEKVFSSNLGVLGKRKFAIKYQFRDENNKLRHWSGVGKMPVFLRNYQDNGGDIEDFNVLNEQANP